MAQVTIRNRRDGVVEIVPKVALVDGSDRLSVVVTVLLVAGSLFLSGALPAPALAAIAASCLAGEAFLGLRALALVAFRPAAEVYDVARWRGRRS